MRCVLILGLLMTPLTAAAQDATDEGLGLVERGLGIIAENLWLEFAPHLDGLSGALAELGPVVEDLSVLIDDLGNYQAPERLDNGDIVIRRKADAPPPPPLDGLLGAPDARPPDPDPPIDPDQPEISL